jgi:predicted amidohydrolase YtcJ
LAGITRETVDPVGGKIERDTVSGEPTGMLKDAAMDLVLRVIPPLTTARVEECVRNALRVARENGVTSVHDVSEEAHVPVYRTLAREDALTCRIYSRLPLSGYRVLVDQNVHHGYGTPFARIGSMKAFADGSLGSNTAWFFEPYVNEPTTGLAMEALTSGQMLEWATEADLHGLQLSIHAIGDRANDAVLGLFESIVRTNPPWDRSDRACPACAARRHTAVCRSRRRRLSATVPCNR